MGVEEADSQKVEPPAPRRSASGDALLVFVGRIVAAMAAALALLVVAHFARRAREVGVEETGRQKIEPSASQRSVTGDALLVFVGRMVAAIAAALALLVVAHRAGPTTFGHYSYIVWLTTVIATCMTLGVPTALSRYVADSVAKGERRLAARLAGWLTLVTVGLSSLVAGILLVLDLTHVVRFGSAYSGAGVPLAILGVVPTVFASCATGVLAGYRNFRVAARINAISQPLTLLMLLVGLIWIRPQLSVFLGYYFLASLITAMFYVAAYRGRGERLDEPNAVDPLSGQLKRRMVRYVGSLSAIVLLDQVVWDKSEVLFLNHYASARQIAFYSLAYMLTSQVMALIPGSIAGVLLPSFATFRAVGDHAGMNGLYARATRYVALLVWGIIGVGQGTAVPFVILVGGANYRAMVPTYCVLLYTEGAAAVASVGSALIYADARQAMILWLGGALCIVNIALDFLLIPHMGAVGAAIANGVAQSAVIVPAVLILRRRGFLFPVGAYVKTIASAAVAAGVALAARLLIPGDGIADLAVGCLAGTVGYIAAVLVLGAISWGELRELSGNRLPSFARANAA